MKTRRFLNLMMASLVAMAYTSCSNSDDVIDTPDPIVKTYTMTVDAQKGSDGTRALSLDGNTLNSTWTKDDAVDVYKGENKIGTLTAQSTGANTSLKGTLSGDLNVNDNLTLKYLSADYNSQDGTLTGKAKSIDKVCDYSTATVTVSGIAGVNISTTNANFENQQAVIKFTLKNADGSASLGNPTAFSVTDGSSTVTLYEIPDETYDTNGSGVLYVAFPATGESATITLSATVSGEVYGLAKTGITFTNSKYYGVTVKMKQAASAPAEAEAVDLGLSVKWANMNVGATSETDYGKYYAWGATTDNYSESKDYNWTNTPYYTGNGSTHSWSKYTSAPATLDVATDDAARANWGGSWRMPTETEFQELLDNTTRSWQTNYKGVSGCNGYLFTSKKAGYTDKSIFLPAAGYRDGSSLLSDGSYGYYWSSTLYSDNVYCGRNLSFYSGNAYMYYDSRYYGFSVRAVQ